MFQMIRVTCALIESDGRLLCARRSPTMSHPGKWEFPGGKIEEGETEDECLIREIREELGVEVHSPGFRIVNVARGTVPPGPPPGSAVVTGM